MPTLGANDEDMCPADGKDESKGSGLRLGLPFFGTSGGNRKEHVPEWVCGPPTQLNGS